MKPKLLCYIIPFFLLCSVHVKAQRDSVAEQQHLSELMPGYLIVSTKDSIGKKFCVIGKPAAFKNGIDGWVAYLTKNLDRDVAGKYAKMSKKDSVQKLTVVVMFTVSPIGLVSDVTNAKEENKGNPHSKVIDEALRVVREGPRWEAAEMETFEMANNQIPYDAIVEKKKKGFRKVIYRHKQSITFVVTNG